MADLREYENKDGYRIRATSKAYELYYRKQGFRPMAPATAEPQPDAPESCFAGMKTAELKKYLSERGISFDAKAKQKELAALAEAAEEHTGSGGESEVPEENPDPAEE